MNPSTGSSDDRSSTWRRPLYTSLPESTSAPHHTSSHAYSSVVASNHISRRPPYEPSRTWSPGEGALPETFQQTLQPAFGFGAQQDHRLPPTHHPTALPPRSPLRSGTSPRRPNGTMNYANQFSSPYPSQQPYPLQYQQQFGHVAPQGYHQPVNNYYPPNPPQTHRNLQPERCRLSMVQNPGDVLVFTVGKEKGRKTIDPPPIVEMHVDLEMDPAKLYMNSPNLFCMVQLYEAESEEPYTIAGKDPVMFGTTCSSIHRLKGVADAAGKAVEGGYFIFGDLTIRKTGTWKLKFTLYDIPFSPSPDGALGNRSRMLSSIFSKAFTVHDSPKTFKGPPESTELTKAFSDQGVRIRLRKEQPKQKRKMAARSPSEDEVPVEVVEKRHRFDDFADHSAYSAGPVQPLSDATPYSTGALEQLSDLAGYTGGQVQPAALFENYNPMMTPGLSSRYQERVVEQYNLLNGANNGFNSGYTL